jgi:predicted Zn-dependent peptidase
MHIVLGFPGLSYTSPDYFTMQVASMILGGGMSSRLFQEVREKRGLAYSISCFTLSYRDCGIFGIYTGTSEDTANEMLEVTAGESIAMLGKLSDSEIERAKVQLKSSILMSLESTSSMFEATGRNILNHGRFRSSDEVIKLIDSVTATDISRVCETIFSGKLSLASLGNVQSLHNYEQISGKFAA